MRVGKYESYIPCWVDEISFWERDNKPNHREGFILQNPPNFGHFALLFVEGG